MARCYIYGVTLPDICHQGLDNNVSSLSTCALYVEVRPLDGSVEVAISFFPSKECSTNYDSLHRNIAYPLLQN